MHRNHNHCPYCGSALPRTDWPRTCPACDRTNFLNPAPVAVLLLPVDDGLLVIRRGFAPGKGKLALPGGFIDLGETWQEACARELFEEAGVVVPASAITLFDTRSSSKHLLVFGLGPRLVEAELPPFVPHPECPERLVIHGPVTLAFPRHSDVVTRYFAS